MQPISGVPITPRPGSAQRIGRPAADLGDNATITGVLGWAGSVAFVLAAAYLIRLAIDADWLTPTVQVACAALFGIGLIAVGFALKGTNRGYAGLLPAAGIANLFLSVYGAHLPGIRQRSLCTVRGRRILFGSLSH